LHDFFIFKGDDDHEYLLDCAQSDLPDLMARLTQYKLRANVTLALSGVQKCFVSWGDKGQKITSQEKFGIADPRHIEMGTRLWVRDIPDIKGAKKVDENIYHQCRISLAIPDGARDIKSGSGGVQENNIDLLNGISFDKGCYIGQEVVARIHYRGLLKKRLIPFKIMPGGHIKSDDIIQSDGRDVGIVQSVLGDRGLAMIKLAFLRKKSDMCFSTCSGKINIYVPNWLGVTVFGDKKVS
jgi:folate-binding protein YgfZ